MQWKAGDPPVGRRMSLEELKIWDAKPDGEKSLEEKKYFVERLLSVEGSEYLRELKRERDGS
jgi:hypothetical protein